MSQRADASSAIPWSSAWKSSNTTFYSTHEADAEFRTSVGGGDEVAGALARLIEAQRARLGRDDFFVVDVGSGSGRLLEQLLPIVSDEIHLLGVDLRERPAELDPRIHWSTITIDESTADITGHDGYLVGVVVAHEFLDDIPCTVVELDADLVPHVVLVDECDGTEWIGPPLDDGAAERMLGEATDRHRRWMDEWWPATRPLARREIGVERARVWDRLLQIVTDGCAVAVDYAHRYDERAAGVWDAGTLRGFRAGRVRRATPDGSVNITSHVALDSLAGAGASIARQAEVLAGNSMASWPNGLGSYEWLVEPIVER